MNQAHRPHRPLPPMPPATVMAIRLLRAMVVFTGVSALLIVAFRGALVRAWEVRNGTEMPSFVPVAVVLFIVFAALIEVLLVFLREGHGWSRLALTVLVAFAAYVAVIGLVRSLPTLFVALSALALVLCAALLYYLWHSDTSDYLRPH